MNRDGFLAFIKKNSFLLVAGAVTVAVLLLAASTIQSEDTNRVSESTELENRLCAFLESMNGVGNCESFVSMSSDGTVKGVAVLCTGGENMIIKSAVENFLHRVLCVPIANISVELLVE